jgi:hypothetical protein
MGGPPQDNVHRLPSGCSRAGTLSADRGLLPRVGRRRGTPADGPLAPITPVDTRLRLYGVRRGRPSQGRKDPGPCPPPLPAYRTHRGRTRSGSGRARRALGTLAYNHDRQATSVTAAPLLAGQRWVARAFWREHALACSPGRGEAQPEPGDVSWKAQPACTSAQLPDLVAKGLGEPELAMGPRRDANREAVGRRDRKLGQFVLGSGADAPDLIATELSEPEIAIGPRRDEIRPAARRRDRELGDDASRGDAPDLVAIELGEPEVAIAPRRDATREAARRRDQELGDDAGRGDTPDLVGTEHLLGEPEVAITPRRDAKGRAAGRRGRKLPRDDASRGDAPDLVAQPLGEPEVAIGTCRDEIRPAAKRGPTVRWKGELGDDAGRGDTPDLVDTESRLGEPEVAIAPRRDAKRLAARRRGRKLPRDDASRGDAPDLVGSDFGEPEVAIAPRRDASRHAEVRRDRKLAYFAGERQGGGSRQGHHADEQAQEPAEQVEPQGEVTRLHTRTKPFCLARPRPDGRSTRDLPYKKSNVRGMPATAPADRYLPHPRRLHRTRDEPSEITSNSVLPLSSFSKNLSATMFLGCQQPCSLGTTQPHPCEERFLV